MTTWRKILDTILSRNSHQVNHVQQPQAPPPDISSPDMLNEPNHFEKPLFLTTEQVKLLYDGRVVLDATTGGFVVGNSHAEYGVKIIRWAGEGKYEIIGELEGWEYLMNPFATNKHFDTIKQMNDELSGFRGEFTEYNIPAHKIDLIDARPIDINDKTTSRILLISSNSQYIINKHSTKKYLMELDKLNKERK